MRRKHRSWTNAEVENFERLQRTTSDVHIIAQGMGRSVQAIRTRIALQNISLEENPTLLRERITASDLRFQTALRNAVELGLERAPIGIYRASNAAGAVKRIPSAPMTSGCSSPAGDCADVA